MSPSPSFSWLRFCLRLALALAAAWLALLAGASGVYTWRLLYPGCTPSASQAEGFEAVTLPVAPGLALRGWWRPPQDGAVVLLLGGLGAGRDAMLPQARRLAARGFGVLTLESRTCAGQASGLGAQETQELAAMLAFAQDQPGVDWVGALGFSVGGAAVLLGAAQQDEIRAVVAEGNYADLYDEMTAVPAAPLSVQWQVQRAVALWYRLLSGRWPGQVRPIQALADIAPRPVLLVHGEAEVERTRGRRQAAAGPSATLWVVPGAGHGQYLSAGAAAFDQHVVAFFLQARAAPQP
ncbi:MAG: hypothetical protein VB089_18415 [Anaerolineaceae bacterium]|nr:hypothetical protein [Anaerolineaceae bacterium]